MNEEDISGSFLGTGNVVASDEVRAVSYHETITWTGITCKKILLQKSIEFGILLK